jgi:hypothetical protein
MNQPLTREEQDPLNNKLEVALQGIAQMSKAEEKLQASIAFMRYALSQGGVPNFKNFWEMRKNCLPFFKEQMPPAMRSQLWSEYIELTREGRRLKDLLDAEAAFAVEQIDLAIGAIEEEIRAFQKEEITQLAQSVQIELPSSSNVLDEKIDYYQKLQKKIILLNVLASRINGLRKELIKTEMRIRQKNGFFQRLSALGDIVFPLRKEMIEEISASFNSDISAFVEEHFSEGSFSQEKVKRNVFFFRDEIKSLQASAKILTLNTPAFTSIREKLSSCWDKLKGMEKELKKEYAQQKQKSAENIEKVLEKISAYRDDFQQGRLTLDEGFNRLDEIARWMREIELTHSDVVRLKEALREERELLEGARQEKEQTKKQKEIEFEKVRQEKVSQLKEKIQNLPERLAQLETSAILQEIDECRKQLSSLSATKAERQHLERMLKMVRDQVTEKQEKALLALSDNEKAVLENYKSILEQRKQRRSQIQAQMEEYRRIIGGSSLDIKEAFRYQELMEEERNRLNEVQAGIAEIEKKIAELRKKNN